LRRPDRFLKERKRAEVTLGRLGSAIFSNPRGETGWAGKVAFLIEKSWCISGFSVQNGGI